MQTEKWGSGWKYFVFVGLLHLCGFLFLFSSAKSHPGFLGLGLFAYSLGLRHAFDADHIAAIDNTVRKLVQQKRNPLGVGFYFSLGHSTVVFCMAVVTAVSVHWAQENLPQLQEVGGMIGASVSGLFLLIIGLINLAVLFNLLKLFRQYREGRPDQDEFEKLLESRGFFSRLLRPLYRLVSRSWHVYPLGFLFGLGFDTASEISLLALSAGAAKESLPLMGILSFPLLFAAGMTLMDSADGIFMTRAYRWAFSTPLRKLYYNLSVTALAVAAALLIGLVELIQVLSGKLGWEGKFWFWVQNLEFGQLGYLLVGLFLVAWLVSVGVWKGMRLEERWTRQDV
jgi:high-affinity nickel-transport protein